MSRRLKHWGWGYEDEQPSVQEQRASAGFLARHLGFGSSEPEAPVPLDALAVPPSRLTIPSELASVLSDELHERVLHAYGRSYSDIVRAFRGRFDHVPDLVAHPSTEAEVEAVLAWAVGAGAAVIPYGGGTSVVAGVEPRIDPDRFAGTVTIDVRGLDRVLEVDAISLSARIQAGATGPGLEAQLREHGLTLRHFPQSFEFSTLGGWIATRAGGHFATLYTHIDDLVESVRAVTPAGVWESRRLPGSGAGISPDRMLLGSEGTLGIITEAWMRVRPRPRFRSSAGVSFPSFAAGAQAVRALVQAGLAPAGCRLIDPDEAALTGAGDGGQALLVLGFESPAMATEPLLGQALEICAEHGGTWRPRPAGATGATGGTGGTGGTGAERDEAVGSWREAFLRAPYLRDTFVAMGVLSETFETAVTWERFPDFHRTVTEATEAAVRAACGTGRVTCRFTHVYPDGPALYFTVLAPARRGEELEQWAQIKQAAADAILRAGGTITHHHAVGRDHRPWYDRQRPEPFAAALRGAKRALDPTGALNPGVLIDG
ncbi:MAG TPA: FAD-binding oxidoreductase [Solirubrobacteraceae bacterium]